MYLLAKFDCFICWCGCCGAIALIADSSSKAKVEQSRSFGEAPRNFSINIIVAGISEKGTNPLAISQAATPKL